MFSRAALLLVIFTCTAAAGEWPQWRGRLRNGIQPDSPKLLDAIPADGLKELWESEVIPSEDDGGLSSPVAAGGRVFLSLVWHRNVPTEKRQIDEIVLRGLGFKGVEGLSPELIAEMERTRESIPPTLRGKKLEEFTEQWLQENLNAKFREIYGVAIAERFRKGRSAIPFAIFEALDARKAQVFASDAEMRQWLEAQGWAGEFRDQIAAAVPATVRAAEDAIVCLDLATGRTLWKARAPGVPLLGRRASATPCVSNGKVFAVGSARVWCVDAQTGKTIWETPIESERGLGGSPLVTDGAVIVNADGLIALDALTGKERWRQAGAGGNDSSPVVWMAEKTTFVIVNGRKELHAIDSRSGRIAWSAPGGGPCTPAIADDVLVLQAKAQGAVVAYRLTAHGATKLWNHPIEGLRQASSPIISGNAVYLMDENAHRCIDLASGRECWREPAPSEIASPVLADGKLFVMANRGNTLMVLKATPAARTELGKATVRAHWVPSPCICDDRLVLRMHDKLKCWSLLP